MRRAALALLIAFCGSSAGARADDKRITIKASWHFERVLMDTYDVERPNMSLAYRLIEAEVLKRNGLSAPKKGAELALPSLIELLRGAGLPPIVAGEVEALETAFQAMRRYERTGDELSREQEIVELRAIAAKLSDVEASLTKKIDANELPSALAQLGAARSTLTRLSDPKTDMSSVSASKQIVSARRSILRGIANLWAWWTAPQPAQAR